MVSPVRSVRLGVFTSSGCLAFFVCEGVSCHFTLLAYTSAMCEQIKAKASSDFSEFQHNLWNTVWDVLDEFYTVALVLSYLEDFEAARVGLTSHFALDFVSLWKTSFQLNWTFTC